MAETELHTKIIKALRTVKDPEIPVNLYDLGLIYNVNHDDNGAVDIKMTLTTPNCPIAETIPEMVQRAVQSVDGVTNVTVELVWDPKWSADMMSEAAKLELEFTGHTGPGHIPGAGKTNLTIGRKPKRP